MSSGIKAVSAWEILDSRGLPTVACEVALECGVASIARIPAGSVGAPGEAAEWRDGDSRYGGLGVRNAIRSIQENLAGPLRGVDVTWSGEVDRVIHHIDNTPDLSTVGANAAMAVSVAAAKSAAQLSRQPLYQWLAPSDGARLPVPMVNLIFGDAHGIEIQHLVCIPRCAESPATALERVWAVRDRLTKMLDEMGLDPIVVGNSHAGLGAKIGSSTRALELVTDAIERSDTANGCDIDLGIDLAAHRFWDGSNYILPHSRIETDQSGMHELVAEWVTRFPIVAVEDPFDTKHQEAWAGLTSSIGSRVLVIADRLTATNPMRVQETYGTSNAVLVKPNQAGTLTRTAKFIERARQAGLAVVMGSRAGSTEDAWSADVAIAQACHFLKAGATTGSDRTAKWNRLLEAEFRGVLPTPGTG